MPRPTLAPTLKNLRTTSVLLTQTTEEELWSHFTTNFKRFEETADRFMAELEDALRYVKLNPYASCSWRREPPKREFDGELSWIRGDLDVEFKAYFYMYDFFADLRMCDRHLKWSADEEYGQRCQEMLWYCERKQEEFRSETRDLQSFDIMMYRRSEKAWHAKHPEVREEEEMREKHRFHKTQEEWKEYFENDPDELQYYKDGIPKDDETCPLCISKARCKKEANERKERIAREEQEEFEMMKQRREEALRLAEAPSSPREVRNYECTDCDFHTTSGDAHALHMVSPDHVAVKKQKALYCEACKVQCRSPMELSLHKNTKKHKKAESDDDDEENPAVVFRCDACEYSTEYKHVYNTHLKSKKHQSKVSA